MENMKLIICCSSGTEACLKRELEKLGIENPKAIDGKVEVFGNFELLENLCVWLRTADRILIEVSQFKATTFDELFDGVSKINFSKWLKKYTKVLLDGNCFESKLMAIKTCGSVIKKSVMNSLSATYGTSSETGETIKIYFTIIQDNVKIMIDACGNGLHKRGYRELTYTAPLKETLAASMLDLSVYNAKKPFADIFCGSGTIAIETAMIARNIAPNLKRHFDFEKLIGFNKIEFENVKNNAKSKEIDIFPNIYACDINSDVIKMAKENAKRAGVEKYIRFEVNDMANFNPKEDFGVVVSNPPYGDRLSDKKKVQNLYKNFAKMTQKHKNWSFYVLTDSKDFETFMGKKADKKRKIYNAKIECTYYSFMGQKPPKEKTTSLVC